jgi:hypothetical protein
MNAARGAERRSAALDSWIFILLGADAVSIVDISKC